MSINVRKIFRANCGPDAKFIAFRMRVPREGSAGYPLVCVGFSVGKRNFELDGVIHQGDSPDERMTNAVLKIASIAKNAKAITAMPDGGPGKPAPHIERLLS